MTFHNMEIEAAIFDMDGTIFDTERLRFRMLKLASKEIYGEEIADQLLFDSLGVSAVTGEKLAKDWYGDSFPYKEIRRRADELERETVRNNGVPVKDGLYNVLERLKKNNIFIALATSSRREIAEEYLINAKILRYFDILICGDEVDNGKPDPEIFLKAAIELNCSPSKCLIFEDSQNGLIAASKAGGLPIYIKDIKDPIPEVKDLAFCCYEKLTEFQNELIRITPKMSIPYLEAPFPLNQENIIAGIHGFGAIGGGYLAQIFSHWDGYTRPKQIIAATNNPILQNLVNTFGKYRIKYESIAYFQTIQDILLIDMNDEDKMLHMYKESSIIGLSLPEQAIRTQAQIIAKGLMERNLKRTEGVTLLIVMNRINAARFVKHHIKNALLQMTDATTANEILCKTYFIDTVVNRMVSKVSEEIILNRLQKDLFQFHKNIQEAYDDIMKSLEISQTLLPSTMKKVSKHKVKEQSTPQHVSISETLSSLSYFAHSLNEINMTLFSAEPDMPIYVASGSPVVDTLCQVTVIDDIKAMQEIKNKLSNGTHAIIAWYSALLGYDTVGQGMGDPRVQHLAEQIMKYEIKPALIIENPDYKQSIQSFLRSFLKRCRVSFKDKCTRVGRDPMRKLQSGERVIGAIQMAQKYGFNTHNLEFGVACAIMYCVADINPKDCEAVKVKQLFLTNHSVIDVLTYQGDYNKSKYKGLDLENDKELLERIQNHMDKLMEELK